MDKQERCPNKAIYLYAWAGIMREACYDHGEVMMMLGNAIGSPTACTEINTEKPCSHPNDINPTLSDSNLE